MWRRGQPRGALAALCVVLLLAPARVSAGGAEFSPSVVLTTVREMENNCEAMVDNALALNAQSIKFVPTVHFQGSVRF
jgi:hypothetical protein